MLTPKMTITARLFESADQDIQSHTTYTVGEDGHIRSWKMPDIETMDVDEEAEPAQKRIKDAHGSKKEKRKEKKEKRKGESGEKARYKPY